MNSAAQDIKDMLEGESSLGLVFATNLFVGREPTSPDNTVTIFETSSQPPQLTLEGEGATLNYSSVQIRVRNRSYQTGWDMVDSIQDKLHGRAGETWNSTLYNSIYCSSGPAFMDWDDNDRIRFIINFNIVRR